MKKKGFDYKRACAVSLVVSLLLMAFVMLIKTEDKTFNSLLSMLITRSALAVSFFFLTKYLALNLFSLKLKNVALTLPCLLVVTNNLPFIAIIRGAATVTASSGRIFFFAASCIAVAAYEELAFRGVLFLSICKVRRSKRGIFFSVVTSSALFGLFHLLNIIDGAGVGAVLMQIGYSFLIGGMCATVLIASKSILPCIILHAIFNFCGGLVPTLGTGYEAVWDIATIAITVILAVICAVILISYLIRRGDENINSFYLD